MTKEEKINIALIKLQKLLNLAPIEDKEKVRLELSKMVPANANASIHPKIGWGYHEDLIQTGTTFKVTPCYATNEKTSLFDLYANLLRNFDSEFNEIDMFVQGFDVILSEKPKQIKLGFLPTTEFPNKTKVCHISFKISLQNTQKAE